MSTPVKPIIRDVAPGVSIFSVPFKVAGLAVGGRSTAIRLSSGEVWLAASHALEETTKAKLNTLGPVKYLVSGDADHYFYLEQYKKAYPDAVVIGVDGLQEKAKDLKFDGLYHKDPAGTKYGFEDEIVPIVFGGHAKKDVAFYHVPTKSLVEFDLLFNLPATEQFSTSGGGASIPIIGFLFKVGRFFNQKIIGGFITDKVAFKKSFDEVAKLDLARIIPAHGDVVEKDAAATWKKAYVGLI